jgi:hypothetical protein
MLKIGLGPASISSAGNTVVTGQSRLLLFCYCSVKVAATPALGVCVAFLKKQPDALPSRAPPKKVKKYFFELLLIHL